MKRSFKHLVPVLMLSLFIVSCGKSSGKKGSDSSFPNSTSNTINSGTSTGETAQKRLATWIDTVEAKTNFTSGNIIKAKYSCSDIKFIIKLGSACTTKQSTTYAYWFNGQKRSQNTVLASVLVPTGDYVLGNITQSGSLYKVEHVNQNDTTDLIVYTINTQAHAVLNPIQVLNYKAKTQETVLTFF